MSNISIAKFVIKEKNICVKLDWKETENELFHIQIFCGNQIWSGRFSNEFAEKYREAVHESKEEYNKSIKTALINSSDDYIYDFVLLPGDTKSATFSWKKKYKAMLRLHGSVPVHRDSDTESERNLIDFLLDENMELRQTIIEYTKRNDELGIDLHTCKTELESFVSLKTSLEATLYGKFVNLLNSKKRRITLLEENLNKLHVPNVTDN